MPSIKLQEAPRETLAPIRLPEVGGDGVARGMVYTELVLGLLEINLLVLSHWCSVPRHPTQDRCVPNVAPAHDGHSNC